MTQPNLNSAAGTIEVGDIVETLDTRRTITGKVAHVNKHRIATVVGVEWPGGPEKRWTTHVENLALVSKGGQGD
jgi:hypothetical protein